ncbi:hypothetical protein QAD02_007128 [Eretmocerus hayati]|uniref:Uncharacterized protein n=1 Tax=Eretmocerus hayati TaxID=131215 RepID=A0ACC2N359_9HYME|nr:hypothetical protein QAD02_007128 [Eretmocerus hayati]
MFEELRLELNGVEINQTKNVGITTTLKNYLSSASSTELRMVNAGWHTDHFPIANNGVSNFCIPLNKLLGFCEDYKKVILNAKQESVLIRAKSDSNCFVVTQDATSPEITINKIQ